MKIVYITITNNKLCDTYDEWNEQGIEKKISGEDYVTFFMMYQSNDMRTMRKMRCWIQTKS